MCDYLMTSHCWVDLACFWPNLASHACMPNVHSLNSVSNDKPLLGRLCPNLPIFASHMRVCLMYIVSTQDLMTSHCALDYALFCLISCLSHAHMRLLHSLNSISNDKPLCPRLCLKSCLICPNTALI